MVIRNNEVDMDCKKCGNELKVMDRAYAVPPAQFFPGSYCCNSLWTELNKPDGTLWKCPGWLSFLEAHEKWYAEQIALRMIIRNNNELD